MSAHEACLKMHTVRLAVLLDENYPAEAVDPVNLALQDNWVRALTHTRHPCLPFIGACNRTPKYEKRQSTFFRIFLCTKTTSSSAGLQPLHCAAHSKVLCTLDLRTNTHTHIYTHSLVHSVLTSTGGSITGDRRGRSQVSCARDRVRS